MQEEAHTKLQQLKDFGIPGNVVYFCERSFDVFSFETGIDYRNLDGLLKAQKWEEADDETYRVMLMAARAYRKGYLDGEDMSRFPCEDLRKINQLWFRYSDGKFGFSVQKEIYESLRGTTDGIPCNDEIWESFTERCSWYKRLHASALCRGQLPNIEGEALHESDASGAYPFYSLVQRLVTCNI